MMAQHDRKENVSTPLGRGTWMVLILSGLFSLLLAPQRLYAQFNTDRLTLAGRSALYYEDYVLSIQYFNQVVTAKPYLYEPWYLRGVAKYYLDDFVGSEQDVSEAIRLNPYIYNMYELRGLSRIRQKKFAEAIDDYGRSLSINEKNQGSWYNRVLCRMELQEYDQAQAELDSMIVRWNSYAPAYSLKAEVFLHQKDTVSADQWLDKSLEIDPYNADAWTARAMISLSRDRWKDADMFLGKAIHLRPNSVNCYINRALARLNLNNLRGAMADYDTALDLDPNNFLGHYNRGLLRMQLGDDNRAIVDFDYVIKMEPDNVMAIYNRAILNEKTGNLRAAVADYSSVIGQFPNFWVGLAARARCYRRLGMTAKAEMDEFRIFKAQTDKHLGIQPRWSRQKQKLMRKRSEINLDKYNQVVVPDENTMEHEYKSEFRGRIQNRSVEMSFLPMYHLSFFPYTNGVKSYQVYAEEVDVFNAHAATLPPPALHTLYATCGTSQLSEQQSRLYLAYIDTLSARIDTLGGLSQAVPLLISRSVAYTVTQNFDAAVADLTTCLQIAPETSLAWWQRAVCQTLLCQFHRSQGMDMQLAWVAARDDFDEAVRLSPRNAYILFDRANLYAMHSEYDRAIADYTQALSLDPQLAEAYYNRGLAYIQAGNREAGIADLSKAGEQGLYDAYSVIKRQSSK